MRERRWLLLALHGILLTLATTGALKATRPKFKIATSSTTTTTTTVSPTTKEPDAKENEDVIETTTANDVNATTGHTLTGIPQIDYIWDPNLPRELNGYNLSDYPFYNSIPEDIDFKCDGLHDGFYASVPHKCQVYHHCLYGTRYDFLCANFTAFDQKTFICHFVSEVDCVNSKKYWHRNDALYKATTSSTSTTSTTPRPTTTSTTTTTAAPSGHDGPRDRDVLRRRRPYLQRWRPAFDYYDDDYYDDEFDRGRLYGYDRGLYEDYDNRKYRRDRDRDRDLFERNLRDRTDRPPRTERDRDRDISPRDRFPMRNAARRDPMRLGRDPVDDDRPRVRGQDQGFRYRDPEDMDFEERRPLDRPRMGEERRYLDNKRYKDDYDDKEAPAVAASSTGNTEGLVKPAAPVSSVYARPRTPPKIRRPVPLSEQDRYSYKSAASSSSSPTPPAVDEPRRRPMDMADIDYYDEEFEEVRPRRPLRRRPNYRERDRDLYDTRDHDRPYRTRYRDNDDIRPRKHPERPRDRYYDRERSYDRGRERLLDRGNKENDRDHLLDRTPEVINSKPETSGFRPPNEERERDREVLRPHNVPDLPRDNEELVNANHEQSTTTTAKPETPSPRPERPSFRPSNPRHESQFSQNSNSNSNLNTNSQPNDEENQTTAKDLSEKYWRPTQRPSVTKQQTIQPPIEKERIKPEPPRVLAEDYLAEYYDEEESLPPPSSPPSSPPSRPTFRVVKRPFLPSRGGNPNPRGLSPVGAKVSSPFVGRQDEGRSIIHDNSSYSLTTPDYKNINDAIIKTIEPYKEHRYKEKNEEDKRIYNAYKVIQPDIQSKRIPDPNAVTIPTIHVSSTGNAGIQDHREQHKPLPNWTIEEPIRPIPTAPGPSLRPNNQRTPNSDLPTQNPYGNSQYKDDDNSNGQGLRVKQRLNEVVSSHGLQDIPESEYDVTLNDALTPTLNQETSLPSGFALPIHRQPTGRDALLQATENDYEYSKPVNQYQEPQQKFVPSTRFVPPSINRNERPKTIYYRTPETIHVASSIQQYRHSRGSWHDYTGF